MVSELHGKLHIVCGLYGKRKSHVMRGTEVSHWVPPTRIKTDSIDSPQITLRNYERLETEEFERLYYRNQLRLLKPSSITLMKLLDVHHK